MSENLPRKASLITNLIVLGLFAGTLIASACLWWLGDWENHDAGLKLTLKILWGSWMGVCLATLLTQATIFGWTFRQYFRDWPEGWNPSEMFRRRPTRAPWSKSGLASFSFTVAMASVTGLVALTMIVMWILKDVTGEWVFNLVFGILFASWWVVMIVLVLARVAVFGLQRQKSLGGNGEVPPAEGPPRADPVAVPTRGEEP